MRGKVRIFRKFNRYLLVFLTSFILCNGNESNFGKGFVTSILNEPNFSLNNKNSEIQLHDEIKFCKKINFLTEYQDEIFLKLSNNVVIGILENSDLTISNFTQKVSQTKYDTLLREQGNSYFKGLLNEGKLVLITQKFAPSTEFLIETPHSKIEFNVAKCIIKYRYKILSIWLFEGNISLADKQTESIIHLNAPTFFTIDSLQLKNNLPGSENILKYESDYINLISRAEIENERVAFFQTKGNYNNIIMKPKLISKKYTKN